MVRLVSNLYDVLGLPPSPDDHRRVLAVVGVGPDEYVLVPGLGMTHRYLVPLADALASRGTVHTVYVVDLGRDRDPRRVTVPELARLTWWALARLTWWALARSTWWALDGLAVDRPVLVGHSMGAQVVVEMARRRPARSPAVVLLAPVANTAERTGWQQALRLWSGSPAEPLRANMIVMTDSVRLRGAVAGVQVVRPARIPDGGPGRCADGAGADRPR